MPLEQAREEERIREELKEEFSWKKDEEKALFAKRLLEQGRGEAGQPVRCFVLLRLARDLAAENGDIAGVLDALGEMVRRFEAPPHLLKREALENARRHLKGSEEAIDLAREYLRLADEAVLVDDYRVAVEAAGHGEALATRAGNRMLRELAKAAASHVRAVSAEFERLAASIAVLFSTPDDPEANVALGKFHALLKHDLERGLQFLEKAADGRWKDLARLEAEAGAGTRKPAALADRWVELARREASPLYREGMRARARLWYVKAMSQTAEAERGPLLSKVESALETDWNTLSRGALLVFDVGFFAGSGVHLAWSAGGWNFGLPYGRAGTQGRAPHPPDAGWHHVAATWDGRWQRIYVDGDLTATEESKVRLLTSRTVLRLDARLGTQAKRPSRAARFYAGLIDDFALYARPLAEDEVRQLYLHGCRGRGLKER